MKFAVVNLGCKVNRVESDAVAAALVSRGGEASAPEEADLIVVNTCTVTAEADKKARKAVRRALRGNARAAVFVSGCAAALDPQAYRSMDPRVVVVGKAELLSAVEKWAEEAEGGADAAAGGEAPQAADEEASPAAQHVPSAASSPGPSAATPAPSPAALAAPLPVGEGFRTRVGVKVQDGCDNACSYCIVHTARGRSTSVPAQDVVEECVSLARAGVKEIVLTGINLGSYCDGDRRDPASLRLVGLLERLLLATEDLHAEGEPPLRFRISSIEPRDVGDDLIELLARADGRVCRHLHLPLQSGSDKVLREMARPYDIEDFEGLVGRLRGRVPEISLSTDLIVGFPGETDEDFCATLDAARICAFSKLHVFQYSRRKGTPAAARQDQVPPELKAARSRELRALGDELRALDYARRVGTVELALVEDDGFATTESYHEVPAPYGAPQGSLVGVLLAPKAL